MSSEFIKLNNVKLKKLSKNKSKTDVLKKITHLYLHGKQIIEIGDLSQCPHLKVIYLHNNRIKEIENLDKLSELTHLYLQWNNIGAINNLNELKNLRKLYLGYNRIQCLENVDQLIKLEELHLERQKLDNEMEFTFDLASLCGIQHSLKILNISGLKLKSLNALAPLYQLEQLIASENLFENASDIGQQIQNLRSLLKADLFGCPAQRKDVYYRDKITAASESLQILDGRKISPVTKQFLKHFEQMKNERLAKANSDTNAKNNLNLVQIDLTKCRINNNISEFDVSVNNIIMEAIIEYRPRNSIKTKPNYKKGTASTSDLPTVYNKNDDSTSTTLLEIPNHAAVQDLVHFVFDDESFNRFNE